jgi:RPA family protein
LITPNGENISRFWIAGIVTEKYTGDNNYVGLRVEDGTGVVTAKTWDGRLDHFQKWDKIEVLGQVQISERDENIDVFLSPDIIQSISDDNWFLVHRLKIIQQHQRGTSIEVKSAKIGGLELGIASFEDLKIKLRKAVKNLDKGNGVTYDQLVSLFPNVDEVQIDEAITELLESGEFFEPKAGVYSSAIDS